MPAPLDFRWVERIFARLQVRYGSRWLAMWTGIEPAAVQADWSQCLAGITAEQIGYALEHLPEEHPPTVAVFKRLCLNAPEPMPARLPPPKRGPIPPEVAERLRPLMERSNEPPLAWAYRLQEREKSGEVLTPAQRAAWRQALAEGDRGAPMPGFQPIPAELLPPGMREAA